MSYVVAIPDMLTAAKKELARLGAQLRAAHAAAAMPTTVLLPAAADEVSTPMKTYLRLSVFEVPLSAGR